MASTQQSSSSIDVWEARKAEIGWLYQRMTLKAVKEHMERDGSFPVYSLSTWKKKVGYWGFDNKNNKRSTIETAAMHFEECSNLQKTVPYVLSNGKSISEAELKRYLRRSKTVFRQGRPLPMAYHRDAPISFSHHSAVSVELCQQNTQTLPLETIAEHNVPSEDHTLRARKNAMLQHRKNLRNIRMAYLFGQGHVCAADLVVPEIYQHRQTIIKGITDYLQSSWDSGRWSVNERGYIRLRLTGFFKQKWKQRVKWSYALAATHYRNGHILKYRRSLCKALEGVLYGCQSGHPDIIPKVLDAFTEICRWHSPALAQMFIAATADLLGSTADVYPGLQRFISSLASVSPEDLTALLSLSKHVWAESLMTDVSSPSWSAQVKVYRIGTNTSLTVEERGRQLCSHAEALRTIVDMSPKVTFNCLNSAIVNFLAVENVECANSAIQVASDLLQSHPLFQQYGYKRGEGLLKGLRADLFFCRGNTEAAVRMGEESLQILEEIGDRSSFDVAACLADRYSGQGDVRKSEEFEVKFDGILREMENFSLDGTFRDDHVVESGIDEQLPEDHEVSVTTQMDSIVSNLDVEADQIWENFVEGQEYDPVRTGEPPVGWRKEVELSRRNELMLCEPFLDDSGLSAEDF